MASNLDGVSPLPLPGRVNDTEMVDNHPIDHDVIVAQANLLLSKAQLDVDALYADVAALGGSGIPGLTINPPHSGSPFYPLNSLQRWLGRSSSLGNAGPIRQLAVVGSSLSQATISPPAPVSNVTLSINASTCTVSGGGFPGVTPGVSVFDSSGFVTGLFVTKVSGNTLTLSGVATGSGVVTLNFFLDGWPRHLARLLSGIWGPEVGYGFRGIWTPEWTKHSGGGNSWTQITSGASDVSPWAEGWQATSTNTGSPHLEFDPLVLQGVPEGSVACFEIVWIDIPGGANWAYSLNGGSSWTSCGQTLRGNNSLRRMFVNASVSSAGLLLRPNPSGAVGFYTAAFAGVIPYSVTGGPATGTDTTARPPILGPGFMLHDLGHDGGGIGTYGGGIQDPFTFYRTTTGDSLAILDLLSPDLLIIENTPWDIHANLYNPITGHDVQLEAAWNAIIQRAYPYADVLAWNPPEIGGGFTGDNEALYRTTVLKNNIATPNGLVVMDFYDAWSIVGFTGNAAAVAAGLINSGGVHCAQYGHTDEASRFASALTYGW